jgi:hypothetical protein
MGRQQQRLIQSRDFRDANSSKITSNIRDWGPGNANGRSNIGDGRVYNNSGGNGNIKGSNVTRVASYDRDIKSNIDTSNAALQGTLPIERTL